MHFTRNVHYGAAQIVRAGGVCGHEAMYDAQMRQYLLRGFLHFAQTEFNVLQTESEERAVSIAARTTSSVLALQPRVVCVCVWHTKWPAPCTIAVAAQHIVDIFNLSAVNAKKTQINVKRDAKFA